MVPSSMPFMKQHGTSADDIVNSVVSKGDGYFYLGGFSEGNWNGVSAGGRDFVALKMDSNGMQLWE
ncbi:unnamed protein product, partial [Choristocarpus tenellus]